MTSVQSVLKQNANVNQECSESTQCSDYEHLGHTSGVEIVGQDVIRRYLYGLMQGRFDSKTALAIGMGSSRSQLQASIRQGYLTVPQMNALAESMGSSIWGVMNELAILAKGMEKHAIPKLSEEELADLLAGRQRKGKRPVLQGELDEAEFSADLPETPDEEQDDEPSAPASRRPPRQAPAAHSQRRQR